MPRLLVWATLALGTIASAHAQPFPSRAITLIVPFPPGGSTDTAARIMAERMRPILGQPIVIENVRGAGVRSVSGVSLVSGRFSVDEACRRHEIGAISDNEYFASLRNSLGIGHRRVARRCP
jgi:hypothetical protein